MALFTIFFSSFLIALSGAMMPGPLLTATIGEASRRGFPAGPLLVVGHGILELVLVAALLFGLAPYLQQQEVFVAIALSGALILLWSRPERHQSLLGHLVGNHRLRLHPQLSPVRHRRHRFFLCRPHLRRFLLVCGGSRCGSRRQTLPQRSPLSRDHRRMRDRLNCLCRLFFLCRPAKANHILTKPKKGIYKSASYSDDTAIIKPRR
jgi:hypothetical protein